VQFKMIGSGKNFSPLFIGAHVSTSPWRYRKTFSW
jgi:hypothetical protein